MNDKRCCNCEFHHTLSYGNHNVNYCSRVNNPEAGFELSQDYDDYEDRPIRLLTHPNFGCIEFRQRKEDETL